MKLLRRLFTAPIRFYRRFLSPLKPPMCRFSPTCSAYVLEAGSLVLSGTGRELAQDADVQRAYLGAA